MLFLLEGGRGDWGCSSNENISYANIIIHEKREQETVFTCLHPVKVQTRLPRDQRLTKPVNRLGEGSLKKLINLLLMNVW